MDVTNSAPQTSCNSQKLSMSKLKPGENFDATLTSTKEQSSCQP